MDAQELGVLEKFTGENFVSSFTGGPDPSNWHQAQVLQDAFNQLMNAVEVRLVAQGPLASYLSGVGFNYDTDSLVGSVDLTALAEALINATPAGQLAAEGYWSSVAPMVGNLCSELGLGASAYQTAFQGPFSSLNLPFSLDEIVQGNVFLGNGTNTVAVAHTAGVPHYFDGGPGVRYEGSSGSGDVFVFNQGYGQLEINEFDWNASNNVLRLGAGITPDAVKVTLDDNQDILLTIGSNGDQIKLDSEGTGDLRWGVEQVQFADGAAWTQSQLIASARNIQGTAASETLYGTNGADTFDGKGSTPYSGSDVEIGNGGNDTFIFNEGYGKLTINEYDYGASPENVLQLGAGITPDQVVVSVDRSQNIVLTIGTNGDQVMLNREATGDAREGVQQIQFADGTIWTQSQLLGMLATIDGTPQDDTLYGTGGANVFDGKGGYDVEVGNGGNDTYVFNSGYGTLVIKDSGSGVLDLGTGITPSEVKISTDYSGDIVLTIGTEGDQVMLSGMTRGASSSIQQVLFADGTSWTAAQILAWSSDIQGTTGNDDLYGTSGDDVFDGKGGNDYESGRGGNDTFIFNQGYGHLEISEVNGSAGFDSVLELGSGITPSAVTIAYGPNQSLVLTDGNDQITLDGMANGSGRDGVQTVQFADGTVWTASQMLASIGEIRGTAGDDQLFGTSGANLFDGGGGNDYEDGDGGNDTFIFNRGYGTLEIVEQGAATTTGTLLLGPGILPSSVTVSLAGDSVLLTIGSNGDQVKLDYMTDRGSNFGVRDVQFADGTVWTASQILASLSDVSGTAKDDSIGGTSDPSVIDGKGGNDVAGGQGNNDTFVFKAGYGHLTVYEPQAANGVTNVLLFGPDIDESFVTVKENMQDAVVLTDGIAGDEVTLVNQAYEFQGLQYGGVQEVQFADGTMWTAQQLLQRATQGTPGDDVLIGGWQASLLDGKGGNDYEAGGGDGDTFVFNAGYGHLQINEYQWGTANNVLQLGQGISESSISASVTRGDAIVLSDGTPGDQIVLDGEFDDARYGGTSRGIQEVQFADGTTWSVQQLVQLAQTRTGTPGDDYLVGTTTASVFDGKGGNDFETGGGKGDTFVFNAGYGHLEIYEYPYQPTNVLQLGPGISASSVEVSATEDYGVILTDGMAGDEIELDGELGGEGVEQVQFSDGTVWTRQQLLQMAETTTGTPGDDVLLGTTDASLFDGKGGNDYEEGDGNGHLDTFVFNAGYGHLEIDESNYTVATSVLELGPGISESSLQVTTDKSEDIVLTSGTDQIVIDWMADGWGDYGVGQVTFADGTVWTASQIIAMASNVQGTAGNDTLYGTSISSTFDGKGGNDVEIGNGNDDTFIFDPGYGHLEIEEGMANYDSTNVLQFGAGIRAAMVTASLGSNGSIVLTSGTDQVVLDGMTTQSCGIQLVQFADGTQWTPSQILAMASIIRGTAGNDTLSGTAGGDWFDGRGGNDLEVGGGGADTFVFNQGYGHLEIDEQDYSHGIVGKVLKLGPGIAPSSVTVTSDQYQDVVLTSGSDQIQLDGMADNSGLRGVQQVQFADGTLWTAAQMIAWARDVQGTPGNETLYGTNGADIFDGQGGNDIEIGNGGADTFVFNQGYGQLEIDEANYYPGTNSVLRLGAGIDESEVSVAGTSSRGLVLTDGIAGDQITLDNALYGSDYGVQQVQFADGTTWSAQQLEQMATTGNAGGGTLYGTPGADVFDSRGGNATEVGNGGSDTYLLQPGYGPITIVNGISSNNVSEGVLSIAGVNPDNVWLAQVGNNLQVEVMGSTTEATIQNWFNNSYSKLGELTVSGGTAGNMTLDARIDQLVQAMATFSSNNPGFDPTSSANPVINDPTLLTAVNSAWHQ